MTKHNWLTRPTKLQIVVTTRTSARHVLSILKQTATACTNEFQMFDELALAFSGVPEYFPRTSDIDDKILLVVFLHSLYIINLLI